MAALCRILEKYSDALSKEEYDTLFDQVMNAVPLNGDPEEN